MSILRNLLKAAQQAGPGAVQQLKQTLRSSSPDVLQQLKEAALPVAATLAQRGNTAGRQILDALTSPGTAQKLYTEAQRPVTRALENTQAARQAQQAARLGPPAPSPQGWGSGQPRQQAPVRTQAAPQPAAAPRQLDFLAPSSAGPGVRTLQEATPRAAGRIQSYKGPQRGPSFERNVETVNLANQPRAVDVPTATPNPAGTRNFFMEPDPYTGAIEPYPYLVRSAQPVIKAADSPPAPVPAWDMRSIRDAYGQGTVDSLRELAQRASAYYNRPISAAELNAPFFKDFPSQASLEMARRGARGAQPPSPAEAEAVQAVIRNAVGGTRQADLSNLYKMLGAGAATLAGGLGLGAVAYNTFGGGGRSGVDQIPPPANGQSLDRTQPSRTIEQMRQLYDQMSPEGAGAYDPRTSATGGTPGQTAPSVIRISDADSNQRQATANALAASTMRPDAPSSYASIADYYQNRGAYAAQPGVVGNVIEQLIQVDSRFDRPEMQAWAASNPGLAYELLQNQQMPNIQQAEITTELGSNTDNNAIGNSQEEARVVIDGADPAIRDATRPRMAVSLQPYFYNRPGFAGAGRI